MENSADEVVRLTATDLSRHTGAALREVRSGREVQIVDRWGDVQCLIVRPEQAAAGVSPR